MRIVDLSFPIRPHFRWTVESQLRSSHERGDHFRSTIITMICHAYTHVDAPNHFLPAGRDIASMPVDQWVGPAAVVDLTHLGDNGEVSATELGKHAGHVQRGDIVLLRTDWPRKIDVASEDFWRRAPFTGLSGAEWLVGAAAEDRGRRRLPRPRHRPGRLASPVPVMPSAIALSSFCWTRSWPFVRRAASFGVSSPDFTPWSIRFA